MEAGLDRRLWLILAFVLLMRAPFFHGAVQGDDHIYLSAAEHALIEPLHPNNTPYVFRGEVVDLRGHPHGPMVAWVLAGLIAVFGEVREVPFHAAFTVFSLIAAAGMWSLAKRFSPQPLWATLLFLAVREFVRDGCSVPRLLDGGSGAVRGGASTALRGGDGAGDADGAAGAAAVSDSRRLPLAEAREAVVLAGPARAAGDIRRVSTLRASDDGRGSGDGAQRVSDDLRDAAGEARQRADAVHSLLVHRVPRPAAARAGAGVEAAERARDAIPAGVDRDLFLRGCRGGVRRVGAVPAADGGSDRVAGFAFAAAMGRHRVRFADDAESRAGGRELPALGWISRMRGVAPSRFGGASGVGG